MAVRDWSDQFKRTSSSPFLAGSSLPSAPSSGFYGAPGYENPLGKDAPSWDTGKYDWKGNSKGIDWNSGFDIDKTGMFEKLFGKAKETEKYRSMVERDEDRRSRSGVQFGEPTAGRGTQVLENLGALYPQQQAPMFIPGVEGKKGLGSTIGGLVGIGASFIPGLGPGIAAAMPSIGSGIGSLF